MELDDLKKQWKETSAPASDAAVREAIEKRISTFERSGRRIRNAFIIEMIVIAAVYIGLLSMMSMVKHTQFYLYKMIFIISVATAPIIWRLYKSQRWINSMDYTIDVRTNIVAFVRYYKRTLLMYEWGTYLIVLILFAMLFTDGDFMMLPRGAKLAVVFYVVTITLFTRPYIRLVYGRKISAFEDFLKE